MNKHALTVLLAQGWIASSFVSLPDLIGQSRKKELDSPVKPENDSIEFDFYAQRSWRRVLNILILKFAIPNLSNSISWQTLL